MHALSQIGGFFSSVAAFFSTLLGIGDYLIWAVVIAAMAWFACWIFRQSLSSLVGALIAAAALMAYAVLGHAVGDYNKDKIARLEAQIEAQKAQLAVEQATNDELNKSLAEEAGAAEHNAGILADLQQYIDSQKDNPDCGVSEEFTNALKKLR